MEAVKDRELTIPENISAKTLKDMDKAIKNFKSGQLSQPIDLSTSKFTDT